MEPFNETLISWYLRNKRELPWRDTNDAYKIWVSEIILQQTQVQTALQYYYKIIDELPNINAFASVQEDRLLKLWQGLGYYSRARNMHHTAKYIVNELNGHFPNDYDTLIALKGIGPYTAAAIASFSNNSAHAVVDGNVFRFLSRYLGIETPIDSTLGKKEFQKAAEFLLDKKNPALHNQAIMEIGSQICKPSNPICTECPVIDSCNAYSNHSIENLPIKLKKQKQRDRYITYWYIFNDEKFIIKKRIDNDIWKGLYELPTLEISKQLSKKNLINTLKSAFPNFKETSLTIEQNTKVTHKLSHQILHLDFYNIYLKDINSTIFNDDYVIINKDEFDNYAFPRPIHTYLKTQLEVK